MRKSKTIISTPLAQTELVAVPDTAEDSEPALAETEQRALVIPREFHGDRLDRALTSLVPEFSRSYLQQLIADGAMVLNGRVVTKASTAVKAGDRGELELRPTPQSQAFQPEAMALNVVYEDEHLRVLDKPAGLVVHPAPGHWSGTLLNGLLARDTAAQLLPRAGIVHRLDKDTSGLMVVARTRAVMDELVRMIAARTVSRQYLALAHGPWQGAQQRVIQAAMGRDPRNRLRMAVLADDNPSAKSAMTTVDWLGNSAAGCLVRCTLHTGRTHQIRVHMASIGHPLVADETYGGAPAAGLARQALHAFRLAFAHPVTGEAMSWQSPLPDDLAQAGQLWGLSYNEARA